MLDELNARTVRTVKPVYLITYKYNDGSIYYDIALSKRRAQIEVRQAWRDWETRATFRRVKPGVL